MKFRCGHDIPEELAGSVDGLLRGAVCDACFQERRQSVRQTREGYSLSEEKAREIARVGGLPLKLVLEWCLAHWPQGYQHQEWLDTAEAGEIAVWIEANVTDPR